MYRLTFYTPMRDDLATSTSTSTSSAADTNAFNIGEDDSDSISHILNTVKTSILNAYGSATLEEALFQAALAGTDNDIRNMRSLFTLFSIDPNLQHRTLGVTALHCAVRMGHVNVVRFLLHHCGARTDILDHCSRLALGWIVKHDAETTANIVNEFVRVMGLGIRATHLLKRKSVSRTLKNEAPDDTSCSNSSITPPTLARF